MDVRRLQVAEEEKKRPKRPTAAKRDLQNKKRRLINRSFKSRLHTALRSLKDAAVQENAEDPAKQLNQIYRLADKGVARGVIKLGKARRIKSSASRLVGSQPAAS